MDKVRVGIVGCGGFTRYRLGNLAKVKEAEVIGLADPSADQIRITKEVHPHLSEVPEFADYAKMIAELKPDAIMIATPHTQHVDQVIAGFEAGCHVCTEKPMVTTVADALKVIAARDKAKKVGVVSYQRHFQAEFRFIHDRIKSGAAGKVQYVSAFLAQNWYHGTKGTWRQQMSLSGGGQLNDSGSHLVDILLWTSGLAAESVCAITNNFESEVDIDSAVNIRFKGGAIGTISVVGNSPQWHEDITFECEKESYYLRQGKSLSIRDRNGQIFTADQLAGGTTADANFIASCLGKGVSESPFECGLEVIRLTEAAWESAANGGSAVKVKA